MTLWQLAGLIALFAVLGPLSEWFIGWLLSPIGSEASAMGEMTEEEISSELHRSREIRESVTIEAVDADGLPDVFAGVVNDIAGGYAVIELDGTRTLYTLPLGDIRAVKTKDGP